MSCKPKYYVGAGGCKALPDSIEGLLLLDKGHATLTKVNAKLNTGLTGLKLLVAPATVGAIEGCVLDCRNGVEPSGGENEITQSNLNYPKLTNVSAIVLDVYADMSWNDYVNYFAFADQTMEIGLIDAKGNLTGTNASALNFTGFRGKLYLDKKIAPIGADKIKSYHFQVIFTDMEQFGSNTEILTTSYGVAEVLEDINPVGVDISVKTATSVAGLTVVKAVLRNTTTPYAGFTTADEWNVLSAEEDVGVTVVVTSFANAALGEYSLTLADGAAAVCGGDVIIQGSKVSTTMTYLSQPLTIPHYSA